MANDIATQMREKMDNLESVVLAIENLCGVATTIDASNSDQFANLFNFVTCQLVEQFETINGDFKQRVLPLVADIKAMRVS